jgi:hypothetical protein
MDSLAKHHLNTTRQTWWQKANPSTGAATVSHPQHAKGGRGGLWVREESSPRSLGTTHR